MSSSILEFIRNNHEVAEVLEVAIGKEVDIKPNGQKAKVFQQHKIRKLVDGIVHSNKELLRAYEDQDSLLKDELADMKGDQALETFYKTYNSTREFYQKFSATEVAPITANSATVDVTFSGEEIFGKYLDLNPFYLQFSNLLKKANIDQDYLEFLDRFNTFFYIPDTVKSTKMYAGYLKALWNYLADFFSRVNPLINLETITKQWAADYEEKVSRGEISIKGASGALNGKKNAPQPLRLGMFNDAAELETLGMDRLKEALEAMGLKCGGTLSDRAKRLWLVRGKSAEEIPNNIKAKPAKRKAGSEDAYVKTGNTSKSDTTWLEFQISSICELMIDLVVATRRHAEKVQSRTAEEKEAEIREEEFGLLPDVAENQAAADEDDDAPIYNPLNLPLGWDGKPIPYWLYKLHGLGVEFKCEICGNQSYWGRRQFDRHFQEWKHAYGMRCLGVPNTKHFHDITSIQDVLSLYAKIKDMVKTEQFGGGDDEEFEDTEGNVLNRRTYEDLARQGLL